MDTRIKTDTTSDVLLSAEVVQFIKFEDTAELPEMELIDNMIRACRVHFEKRLGLSFIEKTYETFFSCSETPFILPVSPVIDVSKVETVSYEGTKTELVLNIDYRKSGLYEIEITPSLGGYYDLLVTYTAGYGHDDTEELPYDLRQAMLRQIIQWYENRDDFSEFNILPGIDKIANRYRKLFI